jgi:hypothetical protein
MIRRVALTLLVAALSALAHADSPVYRTPFDELAQFQQNQFLIEALVESGLRLVEEDDPLSRADACAQLARSFADEVHKAAQERDASRTAELGKHLHNLLERGVATNLREARQQIPMGSTAELKLAAVSRLAAELLQPLRASLQSAADGEKLPHVRTALEELFRKQADLEKTLRPIGAEAH